MSEFGWLVSLNLCRTLNSVVPMPLFSFGLLFLIRLPCKLGLASAFEMGGIPHDNPFI
jgi:hypothetical protein